mmetsp:Transcript_97101/g.274477  ORF Transcript_97101/g.274477 Transcript_97101/m.274477 type:complete len:523 (+) Transcript_97101:135-1703(+)
MLVRRSPFGENRVGSMPVLNEGQTTLTLIARVGLTNFQLLQCVMAVVFLVYAADGAMLPGVFKAIEEKFRGATPVSLGSILLAEALCHSMAVLVWGIFADRHCKLTLLQYAMVCWGLLTLATAFVDRIGTLIIVRSLAGIVGAGLGPLSQGLIGAVCPPRERGRAFGFLIACGAAGHICGLMLAGTTSHNTAIGGWRGSFAIFALATLLVAYMLALVREEVDNGFFAQSRTWAKLESRRYAIEDSSTKKQLTDLLSNFVLIARRRSFVVLVLQGAFASTTVKALTYQVMWFQYLGFGDVRASTITSAVPLGSMFGALLSGHISDALAVRFPNHGRIFFAQAADLVKLVIYATTFHVCAAPDPNSSYTFALVFGLSFLSGVFCIMAYAGVVKPLFAEIVPEFVIAQVIAMAAAIDGAFSAVAGLPLVGYITEHVFGYEHTSLMIADMPTKLRVANAAALGKAITVVSVGSTLLTVCAFGFLHWTYPADRDASIAAKNAGLEGRILSYESTSDYEGDDAQEASR